MNALEKFAEIVRIENPKDIQEVAEVYGYTIASACKYILRYKNKGQYQNDLLKIAHLIENLN